MQRAREYMLVASLLAVVMLGATGSNATARSHRAGKVDDGIIATILNFFGITPQNQISIPPA